MGDTLHPKSQTQYSSGINNHGGSMGDTKRESTEPRGSWMESPINLPNHVQPCSFWFIGFTGFVRFIGFIGLR